MDPYFGYKPQWLCILQTQPTVRVHRFFLASEVSSCEPLQGLCSPGLLFLHFWCSQNEYRTKFQCQVLAEDIEKGPGTYCWEHGIVVTLENSSHGSSSSSPRSALMEVQRHAVAQLLTARTKPTENGHQMKGRSTMWCIGAITLKSIQQ